MINKVGLLGTALFLSACQGFVPGDKDDLLKGCLPNQIKIEECLRANAYTITFKGRLLRTLDGCQQNTAVPLRFDLHAPNGGVGGFEITMNGNTRDDANDEHEVDLTNELFYGTVYLNQLDVTPEIDVFTTDEFGEDIMVDDASINGCSGAPPCENKITGQCNTLSNGNKKIESQVTFENCTPFSAEICYLTDFPTNTSADIHWVLVNTETGDIVQLPNNGRAQNTIRFTAPPGKWRLSVSAQAYPGTTIPINSQTWTKLHFPNIPYNQQHGVFFVFQQNDTGGSSSVPIPTNDGICD